MAYCFRLNKIIGFKDFSWEFQLEGAILHLETKKFLFNMRCINDDIKIEPALFDITLPWDHNLYGPLIKIIPQLGEPIIEKILSEKVMSGHEARVASYIVLAKIENYLNILIMYQAEPLC